MQITRKAELKTVEGPAQFFTGKATITGQFQRDEPSRVSGAIVHFEPGARTVWHSHPLGQTGVGWTQVEGGAAWNSTRVTYFGARLRIDIGTALRRTRL